jgi:hypothetical protein
MKFIKIIISCCIVFIISCRKVEVRPTPTPVTINIFNNTENTIDNGQEIQFELTTTGVYTLTIGDSVANKVLTRERFNGQIGINKKKIYTKGLQTKYLYLLLEDVTKNKIGKTTIIIN